jgi:hypothetical protein
MKLTIPPEAEPALKDLIQRIRKTCPYANTSASAVVAKVLLDFHESATKDILERVAKKLLSPQMKRKSLLQKLADLTQEDSEVALEALEKSVRKLDRSNTADNKNNAEI